MCTAKFSVEHHLLRHLNAHGPLAAQSYMQQASQLQQVPQDGGQSGGQEEINAG